MYLPRAFAETDLAQLDRLLQADPFITLVSMDADGAPFASQLPVLYRRNGNGDGMPIDTPMRERATRTGD